MLLGVEIHDFRCFRELLLSSLPTSGLTVFRGPSGAGKSSLADAVVFALFGSGPRLRASQVTDAIRWGTGAMRTTAHLLGPEGERLVLHRRVDEDGEESVRLEDQDGQDLELEPETIHAYLTETLRLPASAIPELLVLDDEGHHAAVPMPRLQRILGIQELHEQAAQVERERADLAEHVYQLDATVTTLRRTLGEKAPEEEKALPALPTDVGHLPASELVQTLENFGEEGSPVSQLGRWMGQALEASLTQRLAARVSRLEAAARQLQDRVATREEEIREAEALARDWELFDEGLFELSQLFRSTANELADASFGASGVGFRLRVIARRARGEADEEDEDRELSRSEELEKRKKWLIDKIAEEEDLEAQLSRSIARTGYSMVITLCAGLLAYMYTRHQAWLFCVPLVFMVVPFRQSMKERLAATVRRIAERKIELDAVEEQHQDVIRLAALCDQVVVRDRAGLLRALERMPGGATRDLAERLAERFPQFWGDAEAFRTTYRETVEGKVTLKRVMHTRLLNWMLETERAAGECRDLYQKISRAQLRTLGPIPNADGIPPEGLDGRIRRDLELLEHLSARLSSTGRTQELPPAEEEGWRELLLEIDPDEKNAWPDLAGLAALFAGELPDPLEEGDDPFPWVELQVRRAFELVGARAPDLQLALSEPGEGEEGGDDDGEEEAEGGFHNERVRMLAEMERARAEIERQLSATLQRAEGVKERLRLGEDSLRREFLTRAQRYAAHLTDGAIQNLEVGEEGEVLVKPQGASHPVGLSHLAGGNRELLELAADLATVQAAACCGDAQGDRSLLLLDAPCTGASEAGFGRLLALLEDPEEGFGQVLVFTRRSDEVPEGCTVIDLPEKPDRFVFPNEASRRAAIAKALF